MPPWFARAARRRPHPAPEPVGRGTRHRRALGRDRHDSRRRLEARRSRPDAKPAKWLIGEPDLVLSTAGFELPKEGDIPYKYVVFSHVFSRGHLGAGRADPARTCRGPCTTPTWPT